MRTTVEITDEHRARLLEIAARRGEKGFSSIVQEALARYFEAQDEQRQRVRKALGILGTLSTEEADRLQEDVLELRRSWR